MNCGKLEKDVREREKSGDGKTLTCEECPKETTGKVCAIACPNVGNEASNTCIHRRAV